MRIVSLSLMLLLAGCAGMPEMETRLDTAAAMENMETFHLRPHPGGMSESARGAAREIERSIQDALVEKGYRRVLDASRADFEVDYLMFTSERYQEGGHDRYLLGGRVHLLTGTGSELVDPVRMGNLHIHFYRQGKPFFESIASEAIGSGTTIDKRLRATVMRMLSDVPLSCCD